MFVAGYEYFDLIYSNVENIYLQMISVDLAFGTKIPDVLLRTLF